MKKHIIFRSRVSRGDYGFVDKIYGWNHGHFSCGFLSHHPLLGGKRCWYWSLENVWGIESLQIRLCVCAMKLWTVSWLTVSSDLTCPSKWTARNRRCLTVWHRYWMLLTWKKPRNRLWGDASWGLLRLTGAFSTHMTLQHSGLQDGDSLTAVAQQPKVAATWSAFASWCVGADRVVTCGNPPCGGDSFRVQHLLNKNV